jgi:hypothetical protein
MKVQAATLADHAEVVNGKVYLMGGGFDTIYSRTVPVVHRKLHVVLILEVGPAERQRDLAMEVALEDEDGHRLGPLGEGSLRVGSAPSLKPGQASVVPIQMEFEGLEFPGPGLYSFKVTVDGDEIARIPVGVELVEGT